jgi:hypothetical protein
MAWLINWSRSPNIESDTNYQKSKLVSDRQLSKRQVPEGNSALPRASIDQVAPSQQRGRLR